MKNVLLFLLFQFSVLSMAYGNDDNPVKCQLLYCTEKTSRGCDPLYQSFPVNNYNGTSSYWLDDTIGEFGFSIRMYDRKPNFGREKYVNIFGGIYVTKNGKSIFSGDIKLLFKAERQRPIIHSDSTTFKIDFNDNKFLITQVSCGYF